MLLRQSVMVAVCLFVLSGCGGGGGPAVTRYTITDLGYATAISGINKSGQFLLTTANPQDARPTDKTYIVNGSNRAEVDTLSGVSVTVLSLNDAGQLLGTFMPGGVTSGIIHSFFSRGGVLTDLTALANTNFYTAAFNNNGQVAIITQQPTPPPANPFGPQPTPKPIADKLCFQLVRQ